MQTITSKRTRYDPVTYGRMTGELTRLMDATPKLIPDRNEWDIEGDWSNAGAIAFIDKAYMANFAPFEKFDCRVIKLINFDKPAVRLTFYFKHKYWVLKDKDLPTEERERQVTEYLNMLTVKIEILSDKLNRQGLTGPRLSEAKGQIGLMEQERHTWSQILTHLDEYEMAVSNYEREHTYTNANFKYETADQEYANQQEHLLTNQRDYDGNITQPRYNIIFVDPVEILRDHPYQHKRIDRFLGRFSTKSQIGRNTLYIKRHIDQQTGPDEYSCAEGIIEAQTLDKHPTAKKRKVVPRPDGRKGLPKEVGYEPLLPLFPDWEEDQ